MVWEDGEGRERLGRAQDPFGGDAYAHVHSLGCGDGFMGVYTCQNSKDCTL